tara:strand:+ start:89 stop:202 length:114 start_codon:yes stop_codon:yes gene_type:complete
MCSCEKEEYCSLCGTNKNEKVDLNKIKIINNNGGCKK